MSDFESSQKLIKCNVSHLGGSPTTKFIEIDFFKAWAYIMFHRHGLTVSDLSLHLWVDMAEYANRKNIYDTLEPREEVDQLQLLIFCESSNACHTVNRFVLHQEVAEVKKILLSHLCEEIRGGKKYQFVVKPGYSLEMKNESADFLLGLEGSNRSTFY